MARLVEGEVSDPVPEEKTSRLRVRGRRSTSSRTPASRNAWLLRSAPPPAACRPRRRGPTSPGERVSAGERYAAVYEINLSRCIFCGYCEILPLDAESRWAATRDGRLRPPRPDLHQGDVCWPSRGAGRRTKEVEAVVFFVAARRRARRDLDAQPVLLGVATLISSPWRPSSYSSTSHLGHHTELVTPAQ